MPYPDLETLLKQPDKAELLLVMRSPLSLLPHFLVFFLLTLLVFLGNVYLPYYFQYVPILRHISPRIFGIFPLLVLLETIRIYHDNLYILGESIVLRKEGRLSLRYNIPSIRYTDIRGVFVSQTFWGRVFGHGTIYLGTASSGDAELVIEQVADPYGLAKIVEDLRHHNLQREKEQGAYEKQD